MQSAHFQLVADVDRTHWWFAGRREIVGAILREVLSPGATVVDVGCGPGGTVASLSTAYDALGIDLSVDAVQLAADRFPDLTFVCGEAPRDLDPHRQHIDAYLLMDVLEHVEDDVGLLGRLVEGLEAGAIVLVTVPADEALWSEQDIRLGHHRRYSARSLQALWSDLPVEVLLLSPFNSRLYVPIRAIRFVSRITGRSWGDEGSDMRRSDGRLNSWLLRVFAGEQRRLLRRLADRRRPPYRYGVSLVAVLRRI